MLTDKQAVLTPSATGEAPASRATTGSGKHSGRAAEHIADPDSNLLWHLDWITSSFAQCSGLCWRGEHFRSDILLC